VLAIGKSSQISIAPATAVMAIIVPITATVIAIITATTVITVIAVLEYLVADQAAQCGTAQCGQRAAVRQRITGTTA
jgi:anaerobic ribonucleoside-triphosphate reductase